MNQVKTKMSDGFKLLQTPVICTEDDGGGTVHGIAEPDSNLTVMLKLTVT